MSSPHATAVSDTVRTFSSRAQAQRRNAFAVGRRWLLECAVAHFFPHVTNWLLHSLLVAVLAWSPAGRADVRVRHDERSIAPVDHTLPLASLRSTEELLRQLAISRDRRHLVTDSGHDAVGIGSAAPGRLRASTQAARSRPDDCVWRALAFPYDATAPPVVRFA